VPSSKRSDPFEALAHPMRRAILELLRDDPGLPAGGIAERFGEVSRPAVSRHVRVLREAGMVRARTRGREAHYHLVPGALSPARHWLAAFDAMLEGSLGRLKAVVEETEQPGPR
jgi:DNA-binding transcriptional ArsR family regulator